MGEITLGVEGTLTGLIMYAETPTSTVDFLVDDFTAVLVEVPTQQPTSEPSGRPKTLSPTNDPTNEPSSNVSSFRIR